MESKSESSESSEFSNEEEECNITTIYIFKIDYNEIYEKVL